MNTNQNVIEEINADMEVVGEELGPKSESLLQELLKEVSMDAVIDTAPEVQKRRKTAIGITRPNKEQSKKNRKISAESRKKNWRK